MKRSTVVSLIFSLLVGLTACAPATDGTANQDEHTSETANAATEIRPSIQQIDVLGFQNKMKAENTVILDVRTPAEVQEGMIEGAIAIDISASNFEKKVGELDKDKTYLVYCQSGGRSNRACEIMAHIGFKDLYNLKGGYMGWPK